MTKSCPHFTLISASLVLLALFVTACAAPATETAAPTAAVSAPTPVSTLDKIAATPVVIETVFTPIETVIVSPAAYDPATPDSWKTLPVIPETVSQKMKDLYLSGQTSGLNQDAFSKVGDCETSTPYFLAPFDLRETGYRLGEYTSLQGVIDRYKGSFARTSLAAMPGFNVASVLTPFWSDPQQCKTDKGEVPLICEIRVHKPTIMLVMFGTNDVNMSSRDAFEKNLRLLLDFAIKSNVVPVLATKADNLEGDDSINAIIARVAFEYEVPVWNYWRALQGLTNNGLKSDQTHLTYAQPFFDSPENMQMGWPVRNLTALQMLEMLTQELEQ